VFGQADADQINHAALAMPTVRVLARKVTQAVKLVVQMSMSLDGYIAGPNGSDLNPPGMAGTFLASPLPATVTAVFLLDGRDQRIRATLSNHPVTWRRLARMEDA
jgi:hypothetical protein